VNACKIYLLIARDPFCSASHQQAKYKLHVR